MCAFANASKVGDAHPVSRVMGQASACPVSPHARPKWSSTSRTGTLRPVRSASTTSLRCRKRSWSSASAGWTWRRWPKPAGRWGWPRSAASCTSPAHNRTAPRAHDAAQYGHCGPGTSYPLASVLPKIRRGLAPGVVPSGKKLVHGTTRARRSLSARLQYGLVMSCPVDQQFNRRVEEGRGHGSFR